MTALDPASTAFETAIVMPRSLNEPVGLSPSYFEKYPAGEPIFIAMLTAGINGVEPSRSVMTGVFFADRKVFPVAFDYSFVRHLNFPFAQVFCRF